MKASDARLRELRSTCAEHQIASHFRNLYAATIRVTRAPTIPTAMPVVFNVVSAGAMVKSVIAVRREDVGMEERK
jgi:hypothetical protein